MKIHLLTIMIVISCCTTSCKTGQISISDLSLKERLSNKFLIGVALNAAHTSGRDTSAVKLINRHFNSIVAENCMKSEVIHPEENRYDFTHADQFVKFGEDNGMAIIGHCLIWHSQLAPWFCVDSKGQNVSPEILKQRMKNHIHTIVTRYKGRIKGWDVVNEAILEDGSYRKTKFYEILGEEYIPLAFEYAHEADPKAELYYNDYGMQVPGRRNSVVKLINSLKKRGIRVDAIGMQAHIGLDYPDIKDFEKSIQAFATTGAKVMITEWDMSALPTTNKGANISDTVAYQKLLNPYPETLPDSISRKWNKRMGDFFHLFVKHADVITRVTVWGLSDGDSWKNNWPVKGRRDYPLFFDREYRPKPFIRELLSQKE
ncbi:MAG: endo-1,4-beta-xylanase [Bacteroides sp.]|jgi:endo-1,4-beta-xylanase|nr:endo-1,4-beta-xylanase [Bacteroides sp.]